MDSLNCPNCGTAHSDTTDHNLGASLENLRNELEHLWPEEEKDNARMATVAVTRAVSGLSLELDYLWPTAA